LSFRRPKSAADPIAVRDYAQAAEQLGYDHIQSLDHVLGANAASRPGWQGPYDHTDTINEPLILFGYLAGITQRPQKSRSRCCGLCGLGR
jgi:alkanesulfonate monooxygenase SsuD/methylene tetrahydromethanopterin reductase-like flavin-dependent oxidoreductase (luciferase family)